MIINLTTPMSDDKERQQRNKAVLDAIEQYTEKHMNDEYGRIHTDGSRSGGQPVVDSVIEELRQAIRAAGVKRNTPRLYAAVIAFDAAWNTSQPTQSDAEAMRYGFDGFGYKYIDSGSGSDWRTRHPDAEPLYLGQPTRVMTLEGVEAETQKLVAEASTQSGMTISEWVSARLKSAALQALPSSTQSGALQADIDAMKSILWVDTIIDDQEAIAKAFARHRQRGYEAGVKAAAKALLADAKLCDCAALEERECACGAWDDYKSITSARAVEIVRKLADTQ